MIGAAVSGKRVGWYALSGVRRYGFAGVELAAGSPPSESVMSAATMRPPWSQGSVKSSSVIKTMLSSFTPAACTLPFNGRAELWMKSVCGCATPFVPPATPPPAIRIGSHGFATRILPV